MQKAVVTTYGDALEKAASYIVPSILMGLVPGLTQTSTTLNLINGEYFAKESGLQVIITLQSQIVTIKQLYEKEIQYQRISQCPSNISRPLTF